MTTPFIGSIKMFGGNFAPRNYAFCAGQLIPISQNDALFALIGTTYGGDGQNTFALPDLRGRTPIHRGTGPSGTTYLMGEVVGSETVTLTGTQLPAHTHVLGANSGPGNLPGPTGGVWAQSSGSQNYGPTVDTPMSSSAVGIAGGSQPHDNMQPFLAINFIIALFGIFPSQN